MPTLMNFIPSQLRGKGLRKKLFPKYWSIHPKYWLKVDQPRVVYIIGMPRTGSTLMKRYLGEFPSHLEIASFGNYEEAWQLSKQVPTKIVIDKKTGNLPIIEQIYAEYGNQICFAGIIRDPRDELLSLLETERHPEIPKNDEFWEYWRSRYQGFIDFSCWHARRGFRSALLRYEDLVRRPEETKRDFIGWLNIDAQQTHFTRQYASTDVKIADGSDVSEDWKVHQTHTVHSDSIGRWQKIEDARVASTIHAYQKFPQVVDFMQELGYRESLQEFSSVLPGVTILGTTHSR